jgi:sugar lactone lactonase YvrE
MPRRTLFALAAALCALAPLAAVETQTWQHQSLADFEKGTLTRLSLSSEGRIALAPVLREVFDASVTFLWSVATDAKGNVYAGGGALGGGKAKLFAVDAQGRGKTLAELDGIAVQAIAIDAQDRVYAATSPDGKVYRVDASGRAGVFYDPKAKYIWALAFSRSGDLFVATGDEGEIHRVSASGTGTVFFRTEETHVRSLAVDANNNLIAGTEPGGLVIRITPAGEGFVLHQTAKREVTSVAVAPGGTIYAAALGNRTTPTPVVPPPAAPQPVPSNQPGAPPVALPRPAPLLLTTATATIAGGSEVYRILADGYPRKVWSHAQDLVYALGFDSQGRLLAGTGNNGVLYRVDTEHTYTRLLDFNPSQVTSLAAGRDGRLWAVTGNIGKVYSIGPEVESSGVYESDVLDAGAFTYWGRLMHEPESAAGVTIETRSGNLGRVQRNWSPWSALNGGRVSSPPARFLQYKVTLNGSGEVRQVYVAHQPKNVAPVIEALELTPANYRFPAPAAAAAPANPTLTLPAIGRRPTAAAGAGAGDVTLTWAKGQLGVRWLASDDNGDTLLYKAEIRGVNESNWKLIRDKIRERYVSWDSTAFPDGKYVVRITATDATSNPPDQALSASRETDPFQIDNSPPEITGLSASRVGLRIDIRFHAKDALSWLGKAEYSINGGDWLVVEPTTRLTDSNEHDYRFPVESAAGEVTVAVRVADEYENSAVAKTVVR